MRLGLSMQQPALAYVAWARVASCVLCYCDSACDGSAVNQDSINVVFPLMMCLHLAAATGRGCATVYPWWPGVPRCGTIRVEVLAQPL